VKKGIFSSKTAGEEMVMRGGPVRAAGFRRFLFEIWVEGFVCKNVSSMTRMEWRGDIPVFPRLQKIKNLLITPASRFSFVAYLTSGRITVNRLIPAYSVK
jgi:hypothetical protein